MPIDGLNHFNLRVHRSELEAVKDFYVDVLGLVIGERPPFDSSGYWLYADNAPIVHLVEANPDESLAATGPNVIDHLAFQCTDLEEATVRLQSAGVEFEARQVPGTTQHQLFMSDPVGVGVELIFEDLSAAAKRA